MWLQPLILLLLLKLPLPTVPEPLRPKWPKLLLTLLPKLPLQTQAALKLNQQRSTMPKLVDKVH